MTVSVICNRALSRRRLLAPALLLTLVAVAVWPEGAHARFTCSTNDDCAATAAQCDPGKIPCNDGICAPDSPQSDAIGCVLIPNDSKCDDGNFCNGDQQCNSKHGCEDPVIPTCDDGIACTEDSCSTEANACLHIGRNALCNNGLYCDGKEKCDTEEGCVAGTPPDCADDVACTVDACDEGSNSCTNTTSNAACSNGQFCDGVETCNATLGCQPGTPPNCNDNIGCTGDSCNEAIDACNHVANNGLCGDNVSCTVDTCDVATGCTNVPNNASCNDSLYCNGVETCNVTQGCLTGVAPNCSDNVTCTVDTCVEATDSCSHIVSDAACSNGLFCDGVETCSATLGCRPGTAPNCNDKVSCTTDSCNEANDICNHVVNNNSCSNGVFCDGVERCDVGRGCLPPATTACDDGVGCTTDLCYEAIDSCNNVAVNENCSNNRYCDGVETCDGTLGCQPGTPPDCADNVVCTIDACVESSDSCSHVENDSACGNGLYCDGFEQCDELIGCYFGIPPDCSDDVTCTVDTCIEGTDSCTHEASDAVCSDGKFCTGEETCDAVDDCQQGTVPDCTDDIDCTVNSCSDVAGNCLVTPDHEKCTDDIYCNGTELCSPLLGCGPGTPPICNDNLACTDDACVEAGDSCRFDPNGTLCGNGVVEPNCGEECDGNDGEICNNEIDDDGDALVDCEDPDCAEGTEPTCDEECMLVSPCLPLARDPAVISWGASETRAAGAPGAFSFHARLMAATPIDPTTEGVVVTLRNVEGEIFRAELEPSRIKARGARFYFVSKDREEVVRTGGFVRLGVRRRLYAGEVGYGIRVQAYGDFSRATLARMTTQVYFGNDVGFVTADWTGEPGRWILRPKDYEGGLP